VEMTRLSKIELIQVNLEVENNNKKKRCCKSEIFV